MFSQQIESASGFVIIETNGFPSHQSLEARDDKSCAPNEVITYHKGIRLFLALLSLSLPRRESSFARTAEEQHRGTISQSSTRVTQRQFHSEDFSVLQNYRQKADRGEQRSEGERETESSRGMTNREWPRRKKWPASYVPRLLYDRGSMLVDCD